MSRRVEVEGVRTRVLEAGPGSGPEAVVLLHGSPGSANHWDHLLPRVGEFARAVAFDFPGFGEADRPADFDYSPVGWAEFTGRLLERIGVTRAHLVMSDIGGTGVYWAAGHAERFASAVLLNTGALVGYRWHWVARMHRPPLLGELVAGVSRLGFGPVMSLYNRAPRRLPRAVLRQWRREYDWGTRRAMLRFYRGAAASPDDEIAARLRRLDRPALVLWGAHDRFVPLEQAERQRQSFPSAQVVVLEDSGHYPHLDDPERVAEHAIPFLRRQLGVA